MEQDQEAAVRDQVELSVRLLRHLSLDDKPTNLAFSPLSLHAVLSLLASGAVGTTREQIIAFLGPAGADAHTALASKAASVVLASRGNECWKPEVRCAIAIWVDAPLRLNPEFADAAASKLKAAVKSVASRDNPAAASAEINEWFRSETGGLVKDILSESEDSIIDDAISAPVVFLINSLYFNRHWYDPFFPHLTKEGVFHVRVPFMTGSHQHTFMDIGCHPGFNVLRMPYHTGGAGGYKMFAMYIYLPDDRDGLAGLVRKLSSNPDSFLHKTIVPEQPVTVGELKIPKFEVSLKVEVSRLLRDLGLDLPFLPAANDSFLGMLLDSPQGMAVLSLLHRCFVNVNEKGTVAAPGTVGEILGFVMPDDHVVDFVADHPFLFFIMEEKSGLVLFAGQVVNPLLH
ncbi:hypothetical protein E2562_015970 [Oryza meyeriana var. granulata]|uniref:Serpin domain-containing protein n=1 Tax=Oryza meyeriana var. granulata TaxID=110450 RepID=A0A6G1EKI1_9ORYZ|nr:hypothetical protein E2562_015970 [Oryza meyeriana var. granulata]